MTIRLWECRVTVEPACQQRVQVRESLYQE